MRRGDVLDVKALHLDETGLGTAPNAAQEKARLWTLHVHDLLPGESARAVVEHVGQGGDVFARIEARTSEPSPERVPPGCSAFGRCGGCAWQHLAYGAQLGEKSNLLREALGEDAPLDAVVPSPSAVGYRNKAKYVVGREGRRTVLGAYAPRSHDLVPTVGCVVVEPVLDDTARAIEKLFQRAGHPPYDERTREGTLRHLVLRADDDGRVHVLVVATRALGRPDAEALATAISRLRAVGGVHWSIHDRANDKILGAPPIHLAGHGAIVERLSGVEVRQVHAGSFFQVNRAQAHAMYAHVAALLDGAEDVLDLYAGLGGFSFALAKAGAKTLGLEVDAESVHAAADAARRAGLHERARFECVDLAHESLRLHGPLDAVVVNPPRKGLSEAVLRGLAALAPPRIAYVSCHPQSLARDLAVLRAAGYGLSRVTPFDLMPSTAQIEAIALLVR